MYRYRAGASSSAASSRATPTTRCQKCLKLGHYSFDCKSTTQERPYISRPSRTQQLFNPKLQQKLTEAAPPEEPSLANKKGTADGILKKKEQERELLRGRKRRRNSSVSPPRRSSLGRRSRSRSSSVSSYSSTSSTSTHYQSSRNRSRPSHFDRTRRSDVSQPRRSSSRSASRSPDHERSVRRKYRDSPSPGKRGRRLSPTDYSRRTRSPSPRRRLKKSSTPQLAPLRKSSLSPVHRRNSGAGGYANGSRELPNRRSPSRERSMSPFTRRRLMTEAMRRG